MALAIDVISSKNSDASVSTLTTNSFTTASTNEILALFISSDAASGSTVSSVTGAGLTWTFIGREVIGGIHSEVEVWVTQSSGVLTTQTVTANTSVSGPISIFLVTFTGGNVSGTNGSASIGASGGSNGMSGTISTSITTTVNNSWVFASVRTNSLFTAGTGQTVTANFSDNNSGDNRLTLQQNSTTPTSGTVVTSSGSSQFAGEWLIFAVEILPASAAVSTMTGISSITGISTVTF